MTIAKQATSCRPKYDFCFVQSKKQNKKFCTQANKSERPPKDSVKDQPKTNCNKISNKYDRVMPVTRRVFMCRLASSFEASNASGYDRHAIGTRLSAFAKQIIAGLSLLLRKRKRASDANTIMSFVSTRHWRIGENRTLINN